MCGIDDARDVVRHDLGQEDPPCGALDQRECLACDHGGHLRLHAEFALGDDLCQRRGRIAQHLQLEQKAVHLSLWQRIGAFEFDGVLRGEHKERIRQRVRLPEHRHAALLHGFEQCGLRLGRGAVDFICEQQIGEHGPRLKHELAFAIHLLQHRIAGDVSRQQVGRELHTACGEIESFGESFYQFRFSQSRQTFEQHMTACDDAAEHQLDEFTLPKQHLVQGAAQGIDG